VASGAHGRRDSGSHVGGPARGGGLSRARYGARNRPAPHDKDVVHRQRNPPREAEARHLDGLSPGQILAIVLIWVIAYLLPILQLMMPADISSFVANDVATWGFAYAITCAILAKRK
jgi:hypothetical protein